MQWDEVDWSEGGPVWGVPPFEVARLVSSQVGYNDDGPFYIDDSGRLRDERHEVWNVFEQVRSTFYNGGSAFYDWGINREVPPGEFINSNWQFIGEWIAERRDFYHGVPMFFDAGWSSVYRVVSDVRQLAQDWRSKTLEFDVAQVAIGGLPIMSISGNPINWSEVGGRGGRNKWLATIVRRRVNEKRRLLAMSNADQMRELIKKFLISYVLYFKMHPMMVRARRRSSGTIVEFSVSGREYSEASYFDVVGYWLGYEKGWRGFKTEGLYSVILPMVEQRLESDLRWRRSLAWLDEQYQRGLEYYLLKLAERR